MNVVVRGRII